jgi:ribosome-binding factor A
MTVPGHRSERLAEEIRQEVDSMLAGELKDPRLAGAVSVTVVRVTPGLRQARIYVNVAGSEAEQASAMKGLEAASGFIRHELTERLQLRRSLEVQFVFDHSEQYAQRIDELLRQTKDSSGS